MPGAYVSIDGLNTLSVYMPAMFHLEIVKTWKSKMCQKLLEPSGTVLVLLCIPTTPKHLGDQNAKKRKIARDRSNELENLERNKILKTMQKMLEKECFNVS